MGKVTIEADATPLVYFVGTTLRKSAQISRGPEAIEPLKGPYAIETEDGIQSATLDFSDDRVHVSHGVAGDAKFTLTFDAAGPFAWSEGTGADANPTEVEALQRILNPPLMSWRDAAERFWRVNAGDPGFPSRLVVQCLDNNEELVFGSGEPVYRIAGSATELSRVLEGIDSISDSAYLNLINVQGSFAQLSVMVGAGWKVRFRG
ncbi:MAG: hypothetical protein F2840_11410 [Actinobacteria bacterium]|nr:hypothetical protein [Actinomycetota bacterium]